MRKAFTMIELVFVIAVIGILASIAVPKFAATRNDAIITSAKSTIAAVKSSLATERQVRILRGDFTPITSISADNAGAVTVFSADGAGKKNSVLDSTVPLCENGKSGCWSSASGVNYTYKMPDGNAVDFNITRGKFDCKDTTSTGCKELTQ